MAKDNKPVAQRCFYAINAFIITLFSVLCLFPFALVISASLTEEKSLLLDGYSLWPKVFSLNAYDYLFGDFSVVGKAYLISITVTLCGTLAGIIITSLVSYPLSRKRFEFRNFFTFFVAFTMLFNGGMVSWYIVCTRYLGLKDNIFALIVPGLLSAWNVILLRNFFSTIPDSLEESAKIDGAGDFKILFRIMIPLAKPGIATVSLFSMLFYWNDWWFGTMLLNDDKYMPLQVLLMRMLRNVEYMQQHSHNIIGAGNYPMESLRMATCVVAIGPIIFAYPFIQRYFIKGLTVGAIKG